MNKYYYVDYDEFKDEDSCRFTVKIPEDTLKKFIVDMESNEVIVGAVVKTTNGDVVIKATLIKDKDDNKLYLKCHWGTSVPFATDKQSSETIDKMSNTIGVDNGKTEQKLVESTEQIEQKKEPRKEAVRSDKPRATK